MNTKYGILTGCFLALLTLAFVFWGKGEDRQTAMAVSGVQTKAEQRGENDRREVVAHHETPAGVLVQHKVKERERPKAERKQDEIVIHLHAGNFESFVMKCFRGASCELSEDPMGLYEEFKTSQNNRAIDYLISYLRKKLKDPNFRDEYRGVVKDMIEDFYPANEQQFQKAAYYNYLGDLEKSLDLYLDLEKKSAQDPGLRSAPKLNIANTFYDLQRYKEALSYYKSARDRFLSGEDSTLSPSTSTMVRVIEERIDEIERKLEI